MLHDVVLLGLQPLLVEAAAGAVGSAFEHEFAAGDQRGAEPGEGCAGVAGPARDLAEVHVLHGEAAAAVGVRGGEDAELRVQRGKTIWPTLARLRLSGPLRSGSGRFSQNAGQHGRCFARLAGVRDLHVSTPGFHDGFKKNGRRSRW